MKKSKPKRTLRIIKTPIGDEELDRYLNQLDYASPPRSDKPFGHGIVARQLKGAYKLTKPTKPA